MDYLFMVDATAAHGAFNRPPDEFLDRLSVFMDAGPGDGFGSRGGCRASDLLTPRSSDWVAGTIGSICRARRAGFRKANRPSGGSMTITGLAPVFAPHWACFGHFSPGSDPRFLHQTLALIAPYCDISRLAQVAIFMVAALRIK